MDGLILCSTAFLVLTKKCTGESSEEFSFFDFRIVVVPESVGTWCGCSLPCTSLLRRGLEICAIVEFLVQE